MGFKDADWAYGLDLPATPKAVLVALCHRSSDKTHTTLVGQQAVAEMLGVTSRAVLKAMKTLEEMGVIRRERRYIEGGFRTSDRTVIIRNYVNDVPVTQVNDVHVSHVNESHVNESHVNLTTGLPEPGSGQRELTFSRSTSCHSVFTSEAAFAASRPDVKHLLELLDSEIIRNGGRAPKRTKKNIDAARLMIDRDGYTADQIERAIRWCQDHEFWRSVILSMSNLRENYEKLRAQAARERAQQTPKPTRGQEHMAFIERVAASESRELE